MLFGACQVAPSMASSEERTLLLGTGFARSFPAVAMQALVLAYNAAARSRMHGNFTEPRLSAMAALRSQPFCGCSVQRLHDWSVMVRRLGGVLRNDEECCRDLQDAAGPSRVFTSRDGQAGSLVVHGGACMLLAGRFKALELWKPLMCSTQMHISAPTCTDIARWRIHRYS